MEKLEDTLPAFLELAWAINVRDISRTLKHVVRKLLNDAAVDKETRIRRAEGLRILGREFESIGRACEKINQEANSKNEEDYAIATATTGGGTGGTGAGGVATTTAAQICFVFVYTHMSNSNNSSLTHLLSFVCLFVCLPTLLSFSNILFEN
jgi:hypothetical protein